MKFKIGDLVSIISSQSRSVTYNPPALIVNAYISQPKIFLHNKKINKLWLEEEDIGQGAVYDIMHQGIVEEAVLEEWLTCWES
tara:strand:- start:434 stop:682 length:249 start_codon:yes stop_codon:yes gene_type:complete